MAATDTETAFALLSYGRRLVQRARASRPGWLL